MYYEENSEKDAARLFNQFLIILLKLRLKSKNEAERIKTPLIATRADSGSEKNIAAKMIAYTGSSATKPLHVLALSRLSA
jgi:hypothetical protein